jgi:hypothetical protein
MILKISHAVVAIKKNVLQMKQIFVCLSLTSVSSTLELYERSWDAELLAQAAKDGWQNTMRNIINRVFGHPRHLNFITSRHVYS